jgi:hypothetical protein
MLRINNSKREKINILSRQKDEKIEDEDPQVQMCIPVYTLHIRTDQEPERTYMVALYLLAGGVF